MESEGPLNVGLRVEPPLLSDVLVTLLRLPGVRVTLLGESDAGNTDNMSAAPNVAVITGGRPTPADVELILMLPGDPGNGLPAVDAWGAGDVEPMGDGLVIVVERLEQVIDTIGFLVSGRPPHG